LKILFIGFVDLARPGGATTHVVELIAGLRGLGHEITLVANSSKPVDGLEGFHSIGSYLDGKNQGSILIGLCLSLIRGLATVLAASRYVDLIYVRDYLGGIVAWPSVRIFQKPVVYEINGIAVDERRAYGDSAFNHLYSRFIDLAEGVTVRLAQHFVAVTNQLKEYLVSNYRLDPQFVAVINNGVNTDIFKPLAEEGLVSLRRELKLNNTYKTVVFTGTLSVWQGLDTLLEAVANVIEVFPQVYFLVVGDGPLINKLKYKSDQLGIAGNVVFTGWIQREYMPQYINLADICVVLKKPMASGYSPVKVYEYMACGKPILASRVPGLEFIETEGIGRLAEPNDSRSVAAELVNMLENDEFRQRASVIASQLAAERYSWAFVAEQVGRVCLDAVNTK